MSEFEIDIFVDDVRWTETVDQLDSLASRAINGALAKLGSEAKKFEEVSIALVNDEKIQKLNTQYRHKDKPTNVLSFPGIEIDGFTPLLGDIVLAYETIVREAQAQNIKLEDHVIHLMVHGFLHLNGYDHADEADADIMETLEIKTLEGLGIANPYVKDKTL